MIGNALPGTYFNMLLRALDRNQDILSFALARSSHLNMFPGEVHRSATAEDHCRRRLQGLLTRIDAAPLYSFSPSAMVRLGHRPADGWPCIFPTWPIGGCVIECPHSAMFIMQTDPETVEIKWKNPEDAHNTTLWLACGVWNEHLPDETNKLSDWETTTLMLGLVGAVKGVSICPVLGDSFGLPSNPDYYRSWCHTQISADALGEIPMELGVERLFTGFAERITETGKPAPNLMKDLSGEPALTLAQVLSNILVDGWAFLNFIDQPTHYVVQERPAHVPEDRAPGKKAARYHDRERWIILDPEEVKVRFVNRTDQARDRPAQPAGTHASPVPHLRRGHTRTLRSDRYTFRRGAVVHVRPTWVGDREWDQGKLRYRVISRLGAQEDQA